MLGATGDAAAPNAISDSDRRVVGRLARRFASVLFAVTARGIRDAQDRSPAATLQSLFHFAYCRLDAADFDMDSAREIALASLDAPVADTRLAALKLLGALVARQSVDALQVMRVRNRVASLANMEVSPEVRDLAERIAQGI